MKTDAVDCLNNPMVVGDKVLWMSGNTGYAGSDVYTVRKITAVNASISRGWHGRPTSVDRNNLVVVTSLLENVT